MGDVRTIVDNVDGKAKPCLAACNDLKYDVLATQSTYPNEHTFSHTPQFCILIDKLRRACAGHKRY